MPAREGIYLGRSHKVPGGVKVACLDWNPTTSMWFLGKTMYRKSVKVDDGNFILLQSEDIKPKDGAKFEAQLEQIDTEPAEVYVIDKIHNHKKVGKSTQFLCSWKGYSKRTKTWEPTKHLTDYGAGELLAEYLETLKPRAAGRTGTVDTLTMASLQLKSKHKLEYHMDVVKAAVRAEEENVIGPGRPLQELFGAERQAVMKDHNKKKVRLRMNPEPKQPSADYPEGRLKMRLLAMGNLAPVEWDTGEPTDAPTVLSSSVRTLIAYADSSAAEDEVMVGDISGAFNLADEYDDGIQRFAIWQPVRGGPYRVFRMKSPLYGTGDAPMKWHLTFNRWITSSEMGYKQSKNDKSVYYNSTRQHRVVKHVDDMAVRGLPQNNLWFKKQCEKQYPIKGWHVLSATNPVKFCGTTYYKKYVDGVPTYGLSQQDDIKAFLEESGFTGVRSVAEPMVNRKELHSDSRGVTAEEHHWIRSCIGTLSYFADHTKYEMSAAVNIIAQTVSAPTQGTIRAVRRVLGWLAGEGVWNKIYWCARLQHNHWDTFVDSDWAGDQKYGNTRSRTGVIILLNGLPVHWRSNKQPETAISSAQAEIYAMSEACKDIRLRLWVAEEIGLQPTYPTDIKVDNQAGVYFQNKMNPATRLKGVFDLRQKWIEELQDRHIITAVKINTSVNLADQLTKPLNGNKLRQLNQCLEAHRKVLNLEKQIRL